MRMLYWMSEHTRQDSSKNDCIKEKVGVALIEKMVGFAFGGLVMCGEDL